MMGNLQLLDIVLSEQKEIAAAAERRRLMNEVRPGPVTIMVHRMSAWLRGRRHVSHPQCPFPSTAC